MKMRKWENHGVVLHSNVAIFAKITKNGGSRNGERAVAAQLKIMLKILCIRKFSCKCCSLQCKATFSTNVMLELSMTAQNFHSQY
jgi:hypothetical protein